VAEIDGKVSYEADLKAVLVPADAEHVPVDVFRNRYAAGDRPPRAQAERSLDAVVVAIGLLLRCSSAAGSDLERPPRRHVAPLSKRRKVAASDRSLNDRHVVGLVQVPQAFGPGGREPQEPRPDRLFELDAHDLSRPRRQVP